MREGKPLPQQELERKRTQLSKDGVGDLDDIGEFGIGHAARHAKPVNKIEMSKQREEEINKMEADDDDYRNVQEEDEESDSKLEIIRLRKQRDKKRKPIDRQSAFIEFKA